jgi:hypothetical protein
MQNHLDIDKPLIKLDETFQVTSPNSASCCINSSC